jgi:hypothetical protein
MKRWLLALAICGCGTPPPVEPAGSTSPSGGATSASPTGTACDAARAKVEQLYRTSASGQAPARVAELVADNTAMVMNDCATAPDRTSACIAAARTAAELQARCLIPLDDEGTEGDRRTP